LGKNEWGSLKERLLDAGWLTVEQILGTLGYCTAFLFAGVALTGNCRVVLATIAANGYADCRSQRPTIHRTDQ
jgi:hypothetical protein